MAKRSFLFFTTYLIVCWGEKTDLRKRNIEGSNYTDQENKIFTEYDRFL